MSHIVFEQLEQRLLLDAALDETPAIQLFNASPALFVENQGQWTDESIRYGFHGSGANVLFKDGGPVFQLFRRELVETDDANATQADPLGLLTDPFGEEQDYITHATQFSVSFSGANPVTPTGLERAETVFNYYVGGKTPAEGVSSYTIVSYEGLYDGIDLLTWGKPDGLKYEFHVMPGTDYEQIVVQYDGIEGLSLDADGGLVVHTALGDLTEDAPYIYQDIDGVRTEVEGSYRLAGDDAYTFDISSYDEDHELIIDPDLAWWSFLGGSGNDGGYGIAADGSGNALLTGYTYSTDFASGLGSGGFDHAYNGGGDAFVAKVTAGGDLAWWSFLGGSGLDRGIGIAADGSGNALLTGYTYSSDFASGLGSGGFDHTYNGDGDAFVAKVTAAGNLAWWSFLGGSDADYGNGIAADGSGNALLRGTTSSSDFAWGLADGTGFDQIQNGGSDAFVAKVTAGGDLAWWSFLGGSDHDRGIGIAADGSGNALLTGQTGSSDFASGLGSGGFDHTYNGGDDAFVAKVTGAGNLAWWSFLGGNSDDCGSGIAADGSGNALLTGYTESSDFASGLADGTGFDQIQNGGSDAFVAKVTAGGDLAWWSFLGGSYYEHGVGIAADGSGNALLTGITSSSDFASGLADGTGFDQIQNGGSDAFVAKVTAGGDLAWWSFLGGSYYDYGVGIAADGSGNALLTGYTESSDFASGLGSGGFDHTYNGGSYDAFVAKISPKNHAVLFSGGVHRGANHVRYYEHTRRLYELLISDFGLPAQNVYVLYADGTSSGIDRVDGANSDMSYATDSGSTVLAATAANVEWTLMDVASKATSDDHFLFWSYDHGGGTDPDDDANAPNITDEEVLCGWGEDINDEDLIGWLRQVDAGYSSYVFCQCFSGGMIEDDLQPLEANEFACASTNHYEPGWSGPTSGFSWAFIDALESGHTSTHAAYQYAYEHTGTATDGEGPDGTYADQVQHPWKTGGDFRIFANASNHAPSVTGMNVFTYALGGPVTITYWMLMALSQLSDADGDSVSFVIESVDSGDVTKDGQPVVPGETRVGRGESVEWEPPPGADGLTEPFTVSVFDGSAGSSDSVAVGIRVGSGGGAPNAEDDTIPVTEDATDEPIDVLANDTGTGTLQVTSVGEACSGSVQLVAGQVLYTAAPDFCREDTFSYVMTDETGETDLGTVTITITPVNDAPRALAETVVVKEDEALNEVDVTENDFDPDSDDLTVTGVGTAGHGTVSLTGGEVYYSPDAGYCGQDSFTYTVSDGESSDTATVTAVVAEELIALEWNSELGVQEVKVYDPETGEMEKIGEAGDLKWWHRQSVFDSENDRLYVAGISGAGVYKLYTIDTTSGDLVHQDVLTKSELFFAGMDNSGSIIALAWNYDDTVEEVYQIDPGTGNVVKIGEVGDLKSWHGQSVLDSDNEKLYVAGISDTGDYKLYTFDLNTGAVTKDPALSVERVPPLYLSGLDGDNKLIGLRWNGAANAEDVCHIDPATGSIDVITQVGDLEWWHGESCFDSDNSILTVCGTSDDGTPQLYTLDLASESVINQEGLAADEAVLMNDCGGIPTGGGVGAQAPGVQDAGAVLSASPAGETNTDDAAPTFVSDELILAQALSRPATHRIASPGLPWPAAWSSDDGKEDAKEVVGLGLPVGSALPLPVSEEQEDALQTANTGQPMEQAEEFGSELIPDPLVDVLAE